MAGKTAPTKCRQLPAAHRSRDESFNRTSFCIWVKGTQIMISALTSVFAKVTMILPPIYVSTVTANQLLPGAGRTFKVLWDRSE